MKLFEFYRGLSEEDIPKVEPKDTVEPVEPEEPVEDEVIDVEEDGRVTDEFRTTVNDGFSRFGCSFLFNVKRRNETQLLDLRTRDTNPRRR